MANQSWKERQTSRRFQVYLQRDADHWRKIMKAYHACEREEGPQVDADLERALTEYDAFLEMAD